VDKNYRPDEENVVKGVREGRGQVFDPTIFDSSGKIELFKRCMKSGYKMDANDNVTIDVNVDFIVGKIASIDLPLCKLRDAILGEKWFDDKSRLDPYLGTEPDQIEEGRPAVEGAVEKKIGGRRTIQGTRKRRRKAVSLKTRRRRLRRPPLTPIDNNK
jgi:hypothetical protein